MNLNQKVTIMSQSISAHNVILEPLYYDSRTVPPMAYHMADKILEDTPRPLQQDDANNLVQIEAAFPIRVLVTAANMQLYDGVLLFRPRTNCDIIEIISHDPECKLLMNGQTLPLGASRFSFLKFFAWATDILIQHDPALGLEVKYYMLDDDLKRGFPEAVNFKLHDVLYGMAAGGIGKIEKPRCHVLHGNYKPIYRKTKYVTVVIMAVEIEKLLADPRLRTYAHNPNVGMIYETMPPQIHASVLPGQKEEFEAFLTEVLGAKIPKGQSVREGGYRADWNDKFDLQEVEQDPEEIQRQIVANTQVERLEVQANVQRLVDVGVLTHQLFD